MASSSVPLQPVKSWSGNLNCYIPCRLLESGQGFRSIFTPLSECVKPYDIDRSVHFQHAFNCPHRPQSGPSIGIRSINWWHSGCLCDVTILCYRKGGQGRERGQNHDTISVSHGAATNGEGSNTNPSKASISITPTAASRKTTKGGDPTKHTVSFLWRIYKERSNEHSILQQVDRKRCREAMAMSHHGFLLVQSCLLWLQWHVMLATEVIQLCHTSLAISMVHDGWILREESQLEMKEN